MFSYKDWILIDHFAWQLCIYYIDPISAVLAHGQFAVEKKFCVKFQNDISKAEGLVRLYI